MDDFKKFFSSTLGIIIALFAVIFLCTILCLMCSAFGHTFGPSSGSLQFTPQELEHCYQCLIG